MQKTVSVLENETCKILWDFEIGITRLEDQTQW